MSEIAASLIVLQSIYVGIAHCGLLKCDPPTYASPTEGINTFRRRRRQKYPWLEINELIKQNSSLREVKLMGRKASLQRRLDKLNTPTDYYDTGSVSKSSKTCFSDWRYLTFSHFIKDPKEGDCWIVRNWWRYTISWVQCEKSCCACKVNRHRGHHFLCKHCHFRHVNPNSTNIFLSTGILYYYCGFSVAQRKYCKGVPHKHPFFIYTCVPGNMEDFSFWIYCPSTKQLHKRTIVLPKCCFCEKYTCYQMPMVLPIPK